MLRFTYHNLGPVRLYHGWNKRQRICTRCQCDGAGGPRASRLAPAHWHTWTQ